MNFEYILSFKTFLSGTAEYHKTKRKAAKRLKKGKKLRLEDLENVTV
jgi:hypothetical protein